MGVRYFLKDFNEQMDQLKQIIEPLSDYKGCQTLLKGYTAFRTFTLSIHFAILCELCGIPDTLSVKRDSF
jgi:hypothetical protein